MVLAEVQIILSHQSRGLCSWSWHTAAWFRKPL